MQYRNAVKVAAGIAALVLGIVPAWGEETRRASNDNIAAAETIADVPFSATADLRKAGVELTEPLSTCSRVKRSVWYRFTPGNDVRLVAEMWGGFETALAVYSTSDAAPETLVEVGCNSGGTKSRLEFDARLGETFLIQLGSVKARAGVADFKLSPSFWRERILAEVSQPVEVSDTGTAQVSIHGRPRPSDDSIYDLSVTAAGQPTIKRGILTFGLVQQEIKLDLVRIPRQYVELDVSFRYRYDSSQQGCITDDEDGNCIAKAPIKNLRWLTGGDASRAELIAYVKVRKDDRTLAERTVTIPYAGQLLGQP